MFDTAMVNEPSVFEPLKFYCTKKKTSVQHVYIALKSQGSGEQSGPNGLLVYLLKDLHATDCDRETAHDY